MAICFSTAWEAKVVINAWWVRHDQVSRTAQTGEFLPSGSFMIRGKRNFLPSCQLQLGFGLMFNIVDDELVKENDDVSLEDESAGSESESETEAVNNVDVNETLNFPMYKWI
uniref:NFACT RNA-binding domain-containing protein n=1 Tax=Ditylenchus dipsaci TaxID=166011 RepID=A0A915E083_9BILA